MGIAIAIPNYNYAEYVGLTLQSVLDGDLQPEQIVVSDNASTDRSVEVVESIDTDILTLNRNDVNIGFAPNLDRAVGQTSSSHVILLSSDDLIGRQAVRLYRDLLGTVDAPGRTLVFSDVEKIDSAGRSLGSVPIRSDLLDVFQPEPEISLALGCEVFSAQPQVVLAWAMRKMRNPFPFLSTCFPRRCWEAIGGYSGARLYNPDLWFNWRLLPHLEIVYYIQRPLFSYRWHDRNQESAQEEEGSLRYLVDQYLNCIQSDESMLTFAGLTRSELADAFLRNDVIERSALKASESRATEARRYLKFGQAVFPIEMRRFRGMYFSLLALSRLGVVGRTALQLARSKAMEPLGRNSARVA